MSVNYGQQIEEYAKKKGWEQPLTPRQYKNAALAVRPAKQKAVDAATAIESRVATALHLRIMPDHIIGQNLAICENCPSGKFIVLRGGQPACDSCSCGGKWLSAKLKDPKQACPFGHWDNRQAAQEVLNGTPESTD